MCHSFMAMECMKIHITELVVKDNDSNLDQLNGRHCSVRGCYH